MMFLSALLLLSTSFAERVANVDFGTFGSAKFYDQPDVVGSEMCIDFNLVNLMEMAKGYHVHENVIGGDNMDCGADVTGPHYNTGFPEPGNIMESGSAARRRALLVESTQTTAADLENKNESTGTWCFTPPANHSGLFDEIVGRSVVVHKNAPPTNPRWFCGNIVLAEEPSTEEPSTEEPSTEEPSATEGSSTAEPTDSTPPEVGTEAPVSTIEMTMSATYDVEVADTVAEAAKVAGAIANATTYNDDQVSATMTQVTRRRLLSFNYDIKVVFSNPSAAQKKNVGALGEMVKDAAVAATGATVQVTSEPEVIVVEPSEEPSEAGTGGNDDDVASAAVIAPFFALSFALLLL